ncbi:MAG: DNA primase DnaG [Methermicoccaceae archaeon]
MQNSDTTKYLIHARISVDGVVERPDVVGAVFGQTEGLLGDDLDLRELQKTGRIGRIDVNIKLKGGKVRGEICLPSSLDKVETAILAASLETIDKIGPCTSKIEVKKIEDVRSSKRKQIVERAHEIITDLFDESVPESYELTEEVKHSVRVDDLTYWGPERLPAGPKVDESDSILVVEGRADVLNLLKYGIKNTVATGGTSVPPSLIELCKDKVVTAFTDGDRGGEMIMRELLEVTDIDYVARAPDGKVVEDLVQREVVRALRQKVPANAIKERLTKRGTPKVSAVAKVPPPPPPPHPPRVHKSKVKDKPNAVVHPEVVVKDVKDKVAVKEEVDDGEVVADVAPVVEEESVVEIEVDSAPKPDDVFRAHLEELTETMKARLLNRDGKVIKEVEIKNLIPALRNSNGKVDSLVFDGVITQRLLDIAAKREINTVVGAKMGEVVKVPARTKVLIYPPDSL